MVVFRRKLPFVCAETGGHELLAWYVEEDSISGLTQTFPLRQADGLLAHALDHFGLRTGCTGGAEARGRLQRVGARRLAAQSLDATVRRQPPGPTFISRYDTSRSALGRLCRRRGRSGLSRARVPGWKRRAARGACAGASRARVQAQAPSVQAHPRTNRTCVPQWVSMCSTAATWRSVAATPGAPIAASTLWAQGSTLSRALAAAAAPSVPLEAGAEGEPHVKDR